MRALNLLLIGAVAMGTSGCVGDSDGGRPGYSGEYAAYDYNRPDPNYGGYDAGRYYRNDRRYRETQLSESDRVYRGNDGRYYCRRSDGTTGLVLGGVAGGALGAAIAPGSSSLLGAIIGGTIGAVAGKAADKGKTRCR